MNEQPISSTTDLERVAQAYGTETGFRVILTTLCASIGLVVPALAPLAVAGAAFDFSISTWGQNLAANRLNRAEEYVNGLIAATLKEMKKLERNLAEVNKRLNQPEFMRLQQKYLLVASTEVIDERLKMLAAAAAGSANVRLTIAEAARVERKLQELDPDDVKALWKIHRAVGNIDLDGTECSDLTTLVAQREATDPLDSGLLQRQYGGFGGVGSTSVTKLGYHILLILEEFLRESVPDSDIAGRQPQPSDRSVNVVQGIISAHPELMEFIDRIEKSAKHFYPYYSLPLMHAGKPASTPCLRLGFRKDAVTDFVQAELRGIPLQSGEFVLKYDEERVENDPSDNNRIDVKLLLEGKHDVLRAIADERRWDYSV